MKTQLKVLFLLWTVGLLSACTSNVPRSVVIWNVEIDLLVFVGYLLVMAIILFFLFVWPRRKSGK